MIYENKSKVENAAAVETIDILLPVIVSFMLLLLFDILLFIVRNLMHEVERCIKCWKMEEKHAG